MRFLPGLLGLFVALLLGALALEGTLRVISNRTNIYHLEMLKYAASLKGKDPTGELSHIHLPNRRKRLMGVEISLNNLGNRGPNILPVKGPNERRILVMGSSITMGWGVPQHQVFTSKLQSTLNQVMPTRYHIENAGVGNYNTHYHRVLMDRQWEVVKPDQVVLQFFLDDPESDPKSGSLMMRNSFALAMVDARGYRRWHQWRHSKE